MDKQPTPQTANYLKLEADVKFRTEKALKALTSSVHMDEGLEGIFSLIDVILGKMRRGESASDISRSLAQSKYGKGFHLATMYDTIFMTEEVLKISWDNRKFPEGQHVSCWEHVIPWKVTLKRIEDLILNGGSNVERGLVKILVEGSVKCFVSGDEDSRLRSSGLNSAMPVGEFLSAIFSRYEVTDIHPIAISFHDYDAMNMKTILNKLRKTTKAHSFNDFVSEIAK